jgi:uncharacterized protein (TIGR00369 family)
LEGYLLVTGTALDRIPAPPCSKLLGWRLVDHDAARGWVRIGFDGKADFLNPAGFIQGGIQAAMLDDTMGPAVWLATDGELYTVTIEMNLQFLKPAKPGPLFGEATLVQLGNSIAFLEGRLLDGDGRVLSRATASARLMRSERALAYCQDLPRAANDRVPAFAP